MVRQSRAARNRQHFMKVLKHILAAALAWAIVSPVVVRAGGLPVIVTQPQNQMAFAGSTATFSVSATGNALNYQWYINNGSSLFRATNASLTLTGLQPQVSDTFYVTVSNVSGVVTSSVASLTTLTLLTGPINPYASGTLGYDLFQSTYTLASSTNKTGAYTPNMPNLGTNSAVWTWPINLSCVGVPAEGYQAVLITSNTLLTCAHFGGLAGQTVTFYDTNGVAWVAVVTNTISVIADMVIAQLSNSAPASIVIPYVLPPNYTNYIAGRSLLGMPAFWPHKNSSHIDYAPVALVQDHDYYGYGTWMGLYHDGYGLYTGTAGTGGDSGSPAFFSLSNNPVLAFATTLIPDAAGLFVSGQTNWDSLVALGLTNGMKILDLSGYPLQTATPPAPDYQCVAPPTNQVAAPGALVTFEVNVSVFGGSPFAYQWQLNGTDLPGATNSTLNVQAVAGNVGNYTVIVSNNLGTVTAGPASLQLQPQSAPAGEPLLPSWGEAGLLLGLASLGLKFLSRRTSPNGYS
jgi:hypothetical protein